MSAQLAVLKHVTAKLDAAGIPYMLTGSVAAGYYGEPRMTREIDIVADLQPADAAKVVAAFGKDFYTDLDAIRVAIASRSAFNLIHTQAVVKVDFIVRKETEHALEEFGRRQQVSIDGSPVWIVTPEDLILAKLAWAKDSKSDRHFRDVKQILASVADLDWSYLGSWSETLDVSQRLRELPQAMTADGEPDTTPAAAARFDALIRARSGSDRVVMMSDMFDLACALVAARVRNEAPLASDAEVRRRLAERLYGRAPATSPAASDARTACSGT